MIECFSIKDDTLVTDVEAPAIKEALEAGRALWVNLRITDEAELEAVLGELFGFDPLTIEDCRHLSKHPKVDCFSGYAFAVVLSPKTTVPSRAEFFMRELDLYLTGQALVTVHRESLQAVQRVRDQISKDGGRLLKRGPAFVLHLLLDTIADRYLTAAAVLDARSAELEELASRRTARLEVVEEILDLQHCSVALSSLTEQTREVTWRLRNEAEHGLFQHQDRTLYSDLNDHFGRAIHLVNLADDRLRSAHSMFSAAQAQKSLDLQLLLGFLLGLLILISAFAQGPIIGGVAVVGLFLAALASGVLRF